MYGKATYIKVNQLWYDSSSQKYQGTWGQVLIDFDGIFILLVRFGSSPTFKVSLEMHAKSPLSGIHTYLHFHCESINDPLHLRCGSYLHEQIDLSHDPICAI